MSGWWTRIRDACEAGLLETQSLKIPELGVELTGADIFE